MDTWNETKRSGRFFEILTIQFFVHPNPAISKKGTISFQRQAGRLCVPSQRKRDRVGEVQEVLAFIPANYDFPICVDDFVYYSEKANNDSNQTEWNIFRLVVMYYDFKAKSFHSLLQWFRPSTSKRLAQAFKKSSSETPSGTINFFIKLRLLCHLLLHWCEFKRCKTSSGYLLANWSLQKSLKSGFSRGFCGYVCWRHRISSRKDCDRDDEQSWASWRHRRMVWTCVGVISWYHFFFGNFSAAENTEGEAFDDEPIEAESLIAKPKKKLKEKQKNKNNRTSKLSTRKEGLLQCLADLLIDDSDNRNINPKQGKMVNGNDSSLKRKSSSESGEVQIISNNLDNSLKKKRGRPSKNSKAKPIEIAESPRVSDEEKQNEIDYFAEGTFANVSWFFLEWNSQTPHAGSENESEASREVPKKSSNSINASALQKVLESVEKSSGNTCNM